MLALCLMLLTTYYALNYAGIIGRGLLQSIQNLPKSKHPEGDFWAWGFAVHLPLMTFGISVDWSKCLHKLIALIYHHTQSETLSFHESEYCHFRVVVSKCDGLYSTDYTHLKQWASTTVRQWNVHHSYHRIQYIWFWSGLPPKNMLSYCRQLIPCVAIDMIALFIGENSAISAISVLAM